MSFRREILTVFYEQVAAIGVFRLAPLLMVWCSTCLLLPEALIAQNLIQNPGFEASDNCPWETDQISLASSWMRPTDGTSDYLHSCAASALVSVPGNGFGWQDAAEGSAYAGIINWVDPGLVPDFANYREYITGALTMPLEAGALYHFEVKVSRAEGFRFAANKLGVYFSESAPTLTSTGSNYFALGMEGIYPQLELEGAELVDTLGWTILSGTYLAAGGENFLTIGNFYPDSETFSVEMTPGAAAPLAYYFIDDLSLTLDNAPPIAEDDEGVVFAGETIDLNILANDFDPEGGLDPSSVIVLEVPTKGTFTLSDESSIAYTATPTEIGHDSLLYMVCDNAGLCDEATVRILIDQPVRSNSPDVFDPIDITPTIGLDELQIPDIITPNGDGYNETFVVGGLDYFPHNRLVIFNRWGSTVFEQTGYGNDWNGVWQRKNVSLPDGTYFYILTIEQDGIENRFSGDLTIFR